MRWLGPACAALIAASPALAQQRAPSRPAVAAIKAGDIPTADAPGTRDLPGLPRYAGSVLLDARTSAFDEIVLPDRTLVRSAERQPPRNNFVYAPPEAKRIEGRLTRLTYLAPEGRSTLEIVRGYQQVVKEAGGKVVYECNREECGGSSNTRVDVGGSSTGMINLLYPADLLGGPYTACNLANDVLQQRYTLVDLPNDAGKAAILAWTTPETARECKAWSNRLSVLVVVLETKAREQRMETVQAAAVAQSLARDGRIALYSILFDTAKAEVKPESQAQIGELANFLKGDDAVRALIVGHTDNQGSLDYNVDLSRRRADAVVKALVAQGIGPGRLTPQGVGMASPLATNDTDEGRTRNRRVELVKQ